MKTESLNVYKLLKVRSGPRALLRSTDGAAKHVAVNQDTVGPPFGHINKTALEQLLIRELCSRRESGLLS